MTLVIGHTSYLAKAYTASFPASAISHDDIALESHIEAHDTVINFSFHPDLRNSAYDATKDVDTKLAKLCKKLGKRLTVLSSRMVYGLATADPFNETQTLAPITPYGQNKKIIEQSCRDVLGDDVLILRMSNIFGFEWPETSGRKTFMSQLLTSLKTTGTMAFDIAPESEKDFLPLPEAVRILHELVTQHASGIYNVAAGTSLRMDDITKALKLGYGNSSAVFTSPRIDSFYMNVSKLHSRSIALPQTAEILGSFEEIGRKLAAA